MVRLKGAAMLQPEPRRNSFNSTMVRLKEVYGALITTSLEMFQFHNGSIKSATSPGDELTVFVVSIPQWFD